MSKKGSKSAKEVRQYNTGDPVLAKMRGYPPWPGIIVDPGDVPERVREQQPPNKKSATYCILFFPQGDYGWLTAHDLSFLQRHEIEAFLADESKKRNGDLRAGYRIALDPAAWMMDREVNQAAAQEAEENAQVDQLASDEDEGAGDDDADADGDGDAMDIDVGLGLAEAKKGRKPAAGRKRKRESDAAAEPKPPRQTKAKKTPAEPRVKKTGAEKEKKPRKNGAGAKSKAVVESEDEGAHATAADGTSAPAGSSKKGGASPPPAKKTRRDREEEDESKTGDAQSVKVRDWRHKLQKTFLSNKGVPKSEAMAELDALFTTVEQYDEMTIEQLQFSKIGKVMRHIAALEDDKIPPRDAEFKFRARAKGLVDKWHRILNANKPAGAGGVTSPVSAVGRGAKVETAKDAKSDEVKDTKEETKEVEDAVRNVDLNGKGAESPAAPVPDPPAAQVEDEATTTAAPETAPAPVPEPATTAVTAVEGGAADAEGEHDADANAEAEDASTHVEDVVMGEA